MTKIYVVHLVRERNGIEPLKLFLDSYKKQDAGIKHKLLIVLKGVSSAKADTYRAVLDSVPYDSVCAPDIGFDIASYFIAAEKVDSSYCCFLNSYSVLLNEGWLAKMYAHAERKGVGVVGATGSYESAYTNFVRNWKSGNPPQFNLKWCAADYRRFPAALKYWMHFAPFPNYHIRTNAFMISRDVMLKLQVGKLDSKRDAERFESGREGMTRQITAMGLKALVIGQDGEAYEKERWYESRTFRSGEQQNLLVADNRTRQYAEADARTKRILSEYAWGRSD